MHGANQFPDEEVPGLRPVVLQYMDECTALGHDLMRGIARALALEDDYFRQLFDPTPFTPFRVFHYPAPHTAAEHVASRRAFAVEHT